MDEATSITEINKFLLIYCSEGNYSEEKYDKSKTISPANQKPFTIKQTLEKGELNLQMAKVSRKKLERQTKRYIIYN